MKSILRFIPRKDFKHKSLTLKSGKTYRASSAVVKKWVEAGKGDSPDLPAKVETKPEKPENEKNN